MMRIQWVTAGEVVPPLARDAAFVWYGRLDDAGALLKRAALTSDDLADLADLAARPQAAWRAERRRATRALLATLVGVHPDTIVLARSPFGALEVLAPAGWWLSVAGQGAHCAIALARVPIGVDIEPLGQPVLPDDLFTPRELRAGGDRLLRWTAKEAHAKRFARADAADPRAIEIDLSGEVIRASSGDGVSRCVSRRAGGAIITVALPV
ncbi:MAG: 4'-phosphopantetheinyl transferase superfamily protein [Candidatus Sphingomonas colombiensis]|nr:4'-phosphopantetheinyl transferase superfamily protein [Sphingomonas sp.]WEK44787.1 MAG: 4'-phosphopantetheinyl transferase superfamily protein [Sphingomonas sp.]